MFGGKGPHQALIIIDGRVGAMRRFDGAKYYDCGVYVNKAKAQETARWIREQGKMARVVEIDQSPRYGRHRGQGAKWYEVWARPPRNSSFTMR